MANVSVDQFLETTLGPKEDPSITGTGAKTVPVDQYMLNNMGPAPKVSNETSSSWLSLLDSFGTGMSKGLSNMVGLPVDIINLGLGYVGLGTQDPLGGSKSLDYTPILNDIAGKIGISVDKAGTTSERLMERIGEEVGANVIPAGAVLRAAKKVPALITATDSVAKRAIAPVVETFRRSPGKATAAEFGIAGSAGLGAGVGRELSDDPLVETGGALLGGISPSAALGAGRLGMAAGKGFMTASSPNSAVKEIFRQNVTLGGKRALENIDANAGARFGTTAQVTNDPGLMALERSVSRSGGRTTGRFAEHRSFQNQEIRGAMLARGAEAGDAAAARDAIQRNTNKILSTLDDKIKEALPDDLGSPTSADLSDLSVKARVGLEDALGVARKTESSMWKKVGSNLEIDFEPLKTTVRSIRQGMGKIPDPDDMPKVANDITKTVKKEINGEMREVDFMGDKESFNELLNVRKRVLNERRIEKGQQSPNGMKISILNQIDEKIMDVLNSVDPTLVDSVADLTAARAFTKSLNDRFTRGSVSKVLGLDVKGGTRTPESESLRGLTASVGGREAAQEFLAAAGGDKGMIDLGTDFIIKDFLNKNMDAANTLVPKRARLWAKNHMDALDEFPEAKSAIENIVKRNESAQRLINKRTRTQKFIEKSAAQEYLGKSSSKGIDYVLGSQNPAKTAKRIMAFMGNDRAAKDGFKRHLWDGITRKMQLGEKDLMEEAFLSPVKFEKSLENYKELFKEVYSKEHLKDLMDVFGKLKMMSKSQRPVLSGGSDTTQNFGISIPQILGRAYNVQRGVVSKTFVLMEGGSRVLNSVLRHSTEEASQRLLQEALIDPDIAKLFITKITPQNEVQIAKRLRGHLLNIARDDNEELQD